MATGMPQQPSDRGRVRKLDDRTRTFFGGPGIGFLAMVAAFFFVVPGIGKVSGFDTYSVAIFLALTAVCIIAFGRVRRRLGERPT